MAEAALCLKSAIRQTDLLRRMCSLQISATTRQQKVLPHLQARLAAHILMWGLADHLRCWQVAFLYRLTEGACPKSYGTSVAHLAGLPASLVQQAARLAEQLEAHQAQGKQLTPLHEANETGERTTLWLSSGWLRGRPGGWNAVCMQLLQWQLVVWWRSCRLIQGKQVCCLWVQQHKQASSCCP